MQAMTLGRLRSFARKPWSYQRRTLLNRLWRINPNIIVPIRLPFGSIWLGQHEYSTSLLLQSGYEPSETAFVHRLLKQGMTVLDIGANRGYYSLLASKLVGPRGHVFAFEPSPRERRFLRANLALNRCSNVTVEPIALGSQHKEAELFIAKGFETGCNSLLSRASELTGHTVPVPERTLDEYCEAHSLHSADLLKIDIEGGELAVFKGANNFLKRRPRPTILCEIIDQLTHQWGDEPSEVIQYLRDHSFYWFEIAATGNLHPMPSDRTSFNGDYVAIPEERLPSETAVS